MPQLVCVQTTKTQHPRRVVVRQRARAAGTTTCTRGTPGFGSTKRAGRTGHKANSYFADNSDRPSGCQKPPRQFRWFCAHFTLCSAERELGHQCAPGPGPTKDFFELSLPLRIRVFFLCQQWNSCGSTSFLVLPPSSWQPRLRRILL